MKKKFHPYLRSVSGLLLLTFFFQDVSTAAIDLKPAQFELFQKPLVNFRIPASIALVNDTLRASGQKTVFLIQDAHTNESGQRNAAKALETILSHQKIKYVFLEAGTGDDSLSFIRAQASLEKRKEAADEYLKKGVLSGSEYMDLTSDHHFILWGVENKALYWKALAAYEAVAKGRENFEDYLKRIETTVETLKSRLFNPSLQAFDEKHEAFLSAKGGSASGGKEKISLTDYFEILNEEAAKKDIPLDYFPHLMALKSLKEKEKTIDFRAANEEQLKAVQTASPEDAATLLSASHEARTPFKFSSADHKVAAAFYRLLEEVTAKQNTAYPNLTLYFAYIKEADKLNPKEILAEQRLLENQIYESLTRNDDERGLRKASENLRSLKSLIDLTLTPEEFQSYKDDPKGFDTAFITGFLNRKIMDLKNFYKRTVFLENGYEEYIKRAETFYDLTVDRDKAFVENLSKKMDAEGETHAVLIAGGYHTPNLKALFKENNISYVVVTPQIYQETNHKRYEKLLLSQRPLTPSDLPLIPSLNKEGRSVRGGDFPSPYLRRGLGRGQEGTKGSSNGDKMALFPFRQTPYLDQFGRSIGQNQVDWYKAQPKEQEKTFSGRLGSGARSGEEGVTKDEGRGRKDESQKVSVVTPIAHRLSSIVEYGARLATTTAPSKTTAGIAFLKGLTSRAGVVMTPFNKRNDGPYNQSEKANSDSGNLKGTHDSSSPSLPGGSITRNPFSVNTAARLAKAPAAQATSQRRMVKGPDAGYLSPVAATKSLGARLAMPAVNPSTTHAWGNLKHHSGVISAMLAEGKPALLNLFDRDPKRAEHLSQTFHSGNAEIFVDYSKNLLDNVALYFLLMLAHETQLEESIRQMFAGERINETEDRAVLHTALRAPAGAIIEVNGQNVIPEVQRVLEQMRRFSEAINSGQWTGYTGKPITDIVNIGIGGSDLGPVMVTEALKPYATGKVNVHFVSNVDGTDFTEKVVKKKLDPETTLFIIASKTFTTQETMTNAETAKKWFLEKAKNEAAVKKHFVALSTNKSAVEKFGIDSANMFEFWDWVGGRYSLWSAIGLSIATYIGFDNFRELLAGAHDMDEHFRTTPFERNIPVILALLSIWYTTFIGAETHAILPYDQYLHRLPAYLQQAVMESNGKGYDRNGQPINYMASPIIFGESGTNGQHSFYQLLHQGKQIVPADFIGVTNSQNPIGDHHEKLLANFLAQTQALAFGGILGDASDAKLTPHRTFPGNNPTNSILINRLTPRALGALVAMYEHQIFVEGAILNIYSFDQWGVELGKVKAGPIFQELKGQPATMTHDASTANLIARIKAQRSAGARLAEDKETPKPTVRYTSPTGEEPVRAIKDESWPDETAQQPAGEGPFIESGARLASKSLWDLQGGVILSDTRHTKGEAYRPVPSRMKIAVLELTPGMAIPTAGDFIHELGIKKRGNGIRFYPFQRGQKLSDVFKDFVPDLVIAPFDGFNEENDRFVQQAVQDYTNARGTKTRAFFYDAPASKQTDIQSPINFYLPVTKKDLLIALRALGRQETQLARTNYIPVVRKIAEWAARHGRLRGFLPASVKYATPLIIAKLEGDGERTLSAWDAIEFFKKPRHAPRLVFSPHPDDEEFLPAVVRYFLKNVKNAKRENGQRPIGVINVVMSHAGDGVSDKLLTQAQIEKVLTEIARLNENGRPAYHLNHPFWRRLRTEAGYYRRLFEKDPARARMRPDVKRQFETLIKKYHRLYKEIQEWTPRDQSGNVRKTYSRELRDLVRRFIRFIEAHEAADVYSQGAPTRIATEWPDLIASAFRHKMGEPSREMVRFDVRWIKRYLKDYIAKYKEEIKKDGFLEITLPHILDSHPHHRRVTIYVKGAKKAVQELADEGALPVPRDQVYFNSFLAAWAGGHNTHWMHHRSLAGEKNNVRELIDERKDLKDLDLKARAEIMKQAKATGDFGTAMSWLLSELTSSRFGLPSHTPKQMSGGLPGTIKSERLLRQEFLPSNNSVRHESVGGLPRAVRHGARLATSPTPSKTELIAGLKLDESQVRRLTDAFYPAVQQRITGVGALPVSRDDFHRLLGKLVGKAAMYVDLGGSTVRVGYAKLVRKGDGYDLEVREPKTPLRLTDNERSSGGPALFDYLTNYIAGFLREEGLTGEDFIGGVTFSFPNDKGHILEEADGDKGFIFRKLLDAKDTDVLELINRRLEAQGVRGRFTAMGNDTQAALLLGLLFNSNTIAGDISGTGFNIALLLEKLINLEAGAIAWPEFMHLDAYDRSLLKRGVENLIAGQFRGERARLKFRALIDNGQLFAGRMTGKSRNIFDQPEDDRHPERGFGFKAERVSTIAEMKDIQEVIRYLRENVGINYSEEDAIDWEVFQEATYVRDLTRAILIQSAQINAALIAAGVRSFRESNVSKLTGPEAIAGDGASWKVGLFIQTANQALTSLFPGEVLPPQAFHVSGASEKGAALLALILNELASERLTGARLAYSEGWAKGGAVLIEKGKPVDDRVKRMALPENQKIAILELAAGDSIPFAAPTIQRIQDPVRGNEVKTFILKKGQTVAEVLDGFSPDLIIAPFDVFNRETFVQNAILSYANTRGSPQDVFYYDSAHPDISYPVNAYIPFVSHDLAMLLKALKKQDTQLRRTDYLTVLEWLARYAALRGKLSGSLGAEVELATPLTVIRYENGQANAATPEEARAAIAKLSRRVPLLVISPHADDDVIALGGLIRKVLAFFGVGEIGVENWVMGAGADGVSNLTDQEIAWGMEQLKKYDRRDAFYQNIIEKTKAYQELIKNPGGRNIPEAIKTMYDTFENLKKLQDEIELWRKNPDSEPFNKPSAGVQELIKMIIRLEEVTKASQVFGEGLSGKMKVNWLDLRASAFHHNMGAPTETMLKWDVAKVKSELLQFLERHKTQIAEDYVEGIPLNIVIPHLRDSHPHHRISTEVVRQAIAELKTEGKLSIEVQEIDYLAPWAGGQDTYSFDNRTLAEIRADIGERGDIPVERREVLKAQAEAAYAYGVAIAVLIGELAAGRFGLSSPNPNEMSGLPGTIIGQRFKRETIRPQAASVTSGARLAGLSENRSQKSEVRNTSLSSVVSPLSSEHEIQPSTGARLASTGNVYRQLQASLSKTAFQVTPVASARQSKFTVQTDKGAVEFSFTGQDDVISIRRDDEEAKRELFTSTGEEGAETPLLRVKRGAAAVVVSRPYQTDSFKAFASKGKNIFIVAKPEAGINENDLPLPILSPSQIDAGYAILAGSLGARLASFGLAPRGPKELAEALLWLEDHAWTQSDFDSVEQEELLLELLRARWGGLAVSEPNAHSKPFMIVDTMDMIVKFNQRNPSLGLLDIEDFAERASAAIGLELLPSDLVLMSRGELGYLVTQIKNPPKKKKVHVYRQAEARPVRSAGPINVAERIGEAETPALAQDLSLLGILPADRSFADYQLAIQTEGAFPTASNVALLRSQFLKDLATENPGQPKVAMQRLAGYVLAGRQTGAALTTSDIRSLIEGLGREYGHRRVKPDWLENADLINIAVVGRMTSAATASPSADRQASQSPASRGARLSASLPPKAGELRRTRAALSPRDLTPKAFNNRDFSLSETERIAAFDSIQARALKARLNVYDNVMVFAANRVKARRQILPGNAIWPQAMESMIAELTKRGYIEAGTRLAEQEQRIANSVKRIGTAKTPSVPDLSAIRSTLNANHGARLAGETEPNARAFYGQKSIGRSRLTQSALQSLQAQPLLQSFIELLLAEIRTMRSQTAQMLRLQELASPWLAGLRRILTRLQNLRPTSQYPSRTWPETLFDAWTAVQSLNFPLHTMKTTRGLSESQTASGARLAENVSSDQLPSVIERYVRDASNNAMAMKYYAVRIYFDGRLIDEFSINDYTSKQITDKVLKSITLDRSLSYRLNLGGGTHTTSSNEVYITTGARLAASEEPEELVREGHKATLMRALPHGTAETTGTGEAARDTLHRPAEQKLAARLRLERAAQALRPTTVESIIDRLVVIFREREDEGVAADLTTLQSKIPSTPPSTMADWVLTKISYARNAKGLADNVELKQLVGQLLDIRGARLAGAPAAQVNAERRKEISGPGARGFSSDGQDRPRGTQERQRYLTGHIEQPSSPLLTPSHLLRQELGINPQGQKNEQSIENHSNNKQAQTEGLSGKASQNPSDQNSIAGVQKYLAKGLLLLRSKLHQPEVYHPVGPLSMKAAARLAGLSEIRATKDASMKDEGRQALTDSSIVHRPSSIVEAGTRLANSRLVPVPAEVDLRLAAMTARAENRRARIALLNRAEKPIRPSIAASAQVTANVIASVAKRGVAIPTPAWPAGRRSVATGDKIASPLARQARHHVRNDSTAGARLTDLVLAVEGFLVGVAQARQVDGARLALNLEDKRISIFTLSRPRNGDIVVAHSNEFDLELNVRKKAAEQRSSARTAPNALLNVANLRQLENETYHYVTNALGAPTNTEKILVLDIYLGFLPEDEEGAYLEHLVDALRFEKHTAYGENVYFVLHGGNDVLRGKVLSDEKNRGLFIAGQEVPKDAQRVQITTEAQGLSKDIRNVLVRRLEAGQVPAFRATIKFTIFTGRLKLDNITDAYLVAWEALSQQKLTREIARGIIDGTIDLVTAVKYALRPITTVDVNTAVQFFKNMAKMIGKSA